MDLSSFSLEKKAKIITVCLWGTALLFLYKGYFWATYFLIATCSLLRLREDWGLIERVFRDYFVKIYQILIIYFSSVLSIHYINITMGIEKDYLNYSPWIMAVFLSIALLFFFLIITSFLYMGCQSIGSAFRVFVSDGFVSRMKNYPLVRLLDKTWDVVFIAIPFVGSMFFYSDNILFAALRLDAYSASDCADGKIERVYIRKNSNECYSFTSRFGTESPVLIKSKKE
ncbi:hypothetical protein [Pectobacterium versatile]|uniref:hypothetical protein n=1 Tax=Pectobacterium versatile TaxID=2488639 RepID=UPI0020C0DD13|nr:hypothetical protein [Pectobacterium versatile]